MATFELSRIEKTGNVCFLALKWLAGLVVFSQLYLLGDGMGCLDDWVGVLCVIFFCSASFGLSMRIPS